MDRLTGLFLCSTCIFIVAQAGGETARKAKEESKKELDKVEAYARYYAATEELLDSITANPDKTVDEILVTDAGEKYLNEKLNVDTLIYNVCLQK